MESFPKTLYAHHLDAIGSRWSEALAASGFDAAIVLAGQPATYFLDDQSAPFRPNPHFAQWYPDSDCPHSALVLVPGAAPRLLFYCPDDYWHAPPALPDWADAFDTETFASVEALEDRTQALARDHRRVAVIGERAGGNLGGEPNPQRLLHHLDYGRAWKTGFELAAMRVASRRAAAGHLAAERTFREGGSEFDIHLAYLAAARQTPEELPYHSIVAINEHAGILHYQHYESERPARVESFLIDAGASALGYAADVTRTYANEHDGLFADLVDGLDRQQRELIDGIRPGRNYLDLHEEAHRRVASLLATHGLVSCSAESAFENGITRAFLPHGLGHLIGLQTHDVGGHQVDAEGHLAPPPAVYPALRLTREVSPGMVFTIEPGLYFVPQLLAELRDGPGGRDVRWSAIEKLMPCGGIRIEDNVVVTDGAPENLTRDAFALQDPDTGR
jgi:Xaa-Pro dipeptidase